MIVNIRGGCGAGKSTLVRSVMNTILGPMMKVTPLPGKKKISGYIYQDKNLFVPGHYEIQNGGLDTIGDLDAAYAMIRERAHGYHVLYEGMNQKKDVMRVWELWNQQRLWVIMLNTSLDECIASFRAKGQRRDEKYVVQMHAKANRDVIALENLGVDVKILNRADALAETRRLLCLT